MARLDEEFIPADQEESTGYTVVPEGYYNAVIVSSDLETNSKGTGKNIVLEFEIAGGKYSKTKIKQWYCYTNENKTAQDIARSTLKLICEAVQSVRISDTSELHNRPLVIEVVCEKRKDTGDMTNRIKSYHQFGKLEELQDDRQPARKDKAQAEESMPW